MLDFFLEYFFEIMTIVFFSLAIGFWHLANLLYKKHWEQTSREPDESR